MDLRRLLAGGPGEPGLIVHVGRLVEKKGCDVLLAAFAEVAAQVPAARLVIIGEGRLRRRLQAAAVRSGFGGRIVFLGAQDHATVLDWLRRASVVAIPSRSARNGDREGLPIVLLEACALARAILASDIAAISEVVRHDNGALLAPPGDADALARNIFRLLEDPALGCRLGAAARRSVEADHDLARQTAALEALYDAVRSAGEARRGG